MECVPIHLYVAASLRGLVVARLTESGSPGCLFALVLLLKIENVSVLMLQDV